MLRVQGGIQLAERTLEPGQGIGIDADDLADRSRGIAPSTLRCSIAATGDGCWSRSRKVCNDSVLAPGLLRAAQMRRDESLRAAHRAPIATPESRPRACRGAEALDDLAAVGICSVV